MTGSLERLSSAELRKALETYNAKTKNLHTAICLNNYIGSRGGPRGGGFWRSADPQFFSQYNVALKMTNYINM